MASVPCAGKKVNWHHLNLHIRKFTEVKHLELGHPHSVDVLDAFSLAFVQEKQFQIFELDSFDMKGGERPR